MLEVSVEILFFSIPSDKLDGKEITHILKKVLQSNLLKRPPL